MVSEGAAAPMETSTKRDIPGRGFTSRSGQFEDLRETSETES